MDNNALNKLADSLLAFLFKSRNTIFNQNNFIKNFPSPLKEVDDYMRRFSLPPSHIKVIIYLSKSNSSAISQIASNLGISKSNMTPIIDKLIDYDLVNRYSDPNDRRILRIELTPKALEIFENFKIAARNTLVDKISTLSDTDLNTLNECLEKLSGIMKKLD